MVRYTRKYKGGRRASNINLSNEQNKANADKARKNALNRCTTGECSATNKYLADLTNANIARMTRKQLRNLQAKYNAERKNMNNAYARGAKLQKNHNKAVANLVNSSQQLVDGYSEHLRIVEEKNAELKSKQEQLDAALQKAGQINASNAERNNALANVASLQSSVDTITAQLGDVEREKAEKEEELRKQQEFMESEYKRGEELWKQKEEEIADLQIQLKQRSNSNRASIEKALADAEASAADAEKTKKEFEGKLNGLNSVLEQAEKENEEQMKEIESLNEQLADERVTAAANAAAAEAIINQIKSQQALNKNASNAEKKQMQKSLEAALAESKAAAAKIEQIKKEQAAAIEREQLLQQSLADASGKKLNHIKNTIHIIKHNTQELLTQ